MDSSKKYICADCAEAHGIEIDVEKPYMRHICEECGDGKKDLYEVDADQLNPVQQPEEQPVVEMK